MVAEETIFVKILTPQKPFLVKEAVSVEIPAYEGPYLVLPRRAPSLMLLNCGIVDVKDAETQKSEKYFISAGYAKIRDNGCTILARKAVSVTDVDLGETKSSLAELEKKEAETDPKNHTLTQIKEKIAYLRMVVGYCEKRNIS